MTEATDGQSLETNHWQEFSATLKDRLRKPCKHPTFVMYFVGIIILIGGFGILEPIVSCCVLGKTRFEDLPHALISATYTYFVAIAATAAVDLILSYHKRRFLLMFFLLCSFGVVVFAVFAAIYGTLLGKPGIAIIPSVGGYALALFLWWTGNADNVHLLDTPPPANASTGGSTDTKPAGDLAGFNS